MDVIYYILFLLLFLIICSIFLKSIEGFKTMPNSYVNDSTPSRTVNKFGFYKGEGTFKKGYSGETKSDGKISTLNNLLNRLLGRVVSDNNDCVGEFGKYSACDKSCGLNSHQTRTYNISQERGKHGLDCAFEDGYKEKKRCVADECQLGDICENNADCDTGNCGVNSTRCENMVPCDTNNVHVCDEVECIELNDSDNDGANERDNDDVKMVDGVYIYNNVDNECFFKTPAEVEGLNLNIYTYDYRTISEKVKDLLDECEYYEVKSDTGSCINGSNITYAADGPKCTPGFGPEPTMFNGSFACRTCLISGEDGECECPPGKVLNGSNICDDLPPPAPSPPIVDCDIPTYRQMTPGYFAREHLGWSTDNGRNCNYCPPGMSATSLSGSLSCVKCAADNDVVFSSSVCKAAFGCDIPQWVINGDPSASDNWHEKCYNNQLQLEPDQLKNPPDSGNSVDHDPCAEYGTWVECVGDGQDDYDCSPLNASITYTCCSSGTLPGDTPARWIPKPVDDVTDLNLNLRTLALCTAAKQEDGPQRYCNEFVCPSPSE